MSCTHLPLKDLLKNRGKRKRYGFWSHWDINCRLEGNCILSPDYEAPNSSNRSLCLLKESQSSALRKKMTMSLCFRPPGSPGLFHHRLLQNKADCFYTAMVSRLLLGIWKVSNLSAQVLYKYIFPSIQNI